MNAFIQDQTKNWLNRETLKDGLSQMGHWVYVTGEVQDDELDTNAIIYGNVGWVRNIVKRYGYGERWIGHVPEALYPLAGRHIEVMPIRDVLRGRIFSNGKLFRFIKPTPDKNKSFNGFVFTGDQMQLLELVNYMETGDEPIIASDIVNFVSEWRCYVCDGEVLDAKHYKGDFRITPDYSVADRAIELWKDAPVSWSCDIGVTKEGNTLIVECNDVMCLGMYGLSPLKAGLMLEKRWEEIHRNKSL